MIGTLVGLVQQALLPYMRPGKHIQVMPHNTNLQIRSASVSASAGTGKTWMLVSRIIKILLHGVKPDSILAITFTRKAAAEMFTRLAQRLYTLASCDQTQLDKELQSLGLNSTPSLCTQARNLYEIMPKSNNKVKLVLIGLVWIYRV